MKFGYQGAYHVDDRLTTRHDQPHLPVQQRRPEPAHRVSVAAGVQVARSLQRGVRAGQLDPRPADGAGRGPLRPLVELLPRAADRADALPGGRDRLPGEQRRASATTTSRRGSASAYDLFGNGKTALKFNMGRYLEAAVNDNGAYSRLAPSNRLATSTQPDVDRRQRQLQPRLQPVERGGAGRPRRPAAISAARSIRRRSASRPR